MNVITGEKDKSDVEKSAVQKSAAVSVAVAASWESIKVQRFDPGNKMTSGKFELSAIDARARERAAANAAAAAAAEVIRVAAELKEKEKEGKLVNSLNGPEGEGAAGDFANLDVLKNIFYKVYNFYLP